MSIPFKIDYSQYNEDSSPIKSDVNITASHSKLTAQTNNSLQAKEWRKKNPNKASEIASKGGEKSKTSEAKNRMSKIGIKYGAENAIKYIPLETKSTNGKKFGKYNLISDIICSKCGNKTNKGNLRFHEDNCKELDKIKFIELLPSKFTKSIAKKIAEDNKIRDWEKLNIFHKTCDYIKCIIKVDKPNQFNPCWYSKNIKEINKVKKYKHIV